MTGRRSPVSWRACKRAPASVAVLFAPMVLLLGTLAVGAVDAAAQTTGTGHTLHANSGAAAPAVGVDTLAWLQGEWRGDGLGAVAEEVWLPPSGGAMVGVFRLVRDGSVQLYEMFTLLEENGSLVMRLKHFGPDLVGWEAKDRSVTFPLVRVEGDTFWFDGLTIQRVSPDEMHIWVSLQRSGEAPREELFSYRRVATGH